MPDDKDLKTIVEGHIDDNIVDDKDEKPVDKAIKQDDQDDDEDQQDDDEDDVSVDDLAEQKTLLKLLKNPGTRKDTLLALLDLEGVKAPENKREEQQVKRTVLTVLKEKLGDQFDLLPGGDKIAEALEEIMSSVLNQAREGQKEIVLAGVTEKVEKAERLMGKKYDDFSKVKPVMEEVMKTYPWSSATGQSIQDHMEELYLLAKARMEKSGKPQGGQRERQERINRNSERQQPRGVSGHPQGDKPTGKTDLKSIVQQSFRQLSKTRG